MMVARFAPNVPQAPKSVWTHPMELLGDMGHVESRFVLFGDSVSVCGGINPYTLMARHGQAQTRRSSPLHDVARSRSSRWSLAQGIKPDLGIKEGLGQLG
jgi:hypothetical protein